MKEFKFTLAISTFTMLFSGMVTAQKTISEGTLTYSISMQTAGSNTMNSLNGATATVYLKGNLSRTDMTSSLGNEKTIYDGKTGSAVILKEYSGQKLMITLTNENWVTKNKKTNGIQYAVQAETKEILGYSCGLATATLNDGSVLSVYYAKDLTLLNKGYDPTFKTLPGVPMEYEFRMGKNTFTYTITRLDVSAVPAARFEIPKSGYRVITYDENQQGKKEN